MSIFSWMSRDKGGEIIQAMPLRKGFINLVNPAVVNKPRVIYCVTAGDITITWYDGTTDTITMKEADSFTIDNAKSLLVEIETKVHVSGKSVA